MANRFGHRSRSRLFLQALERRETPALFSVNTVAESGAGSFRQAILDSNVDLTDGPDTITFDNSVFGSPQTISLVTALPTIQDNLTIAGPGSGLLTVERNAGAADNFRILKIENTSKLLTVSLSGMTLTKGTNVTQIGSSYQTDNGGGIYTGSEDVTLTDVAVTQCTSNAQGGGIGVADGGRLTLVNCTISGNTAQGLVNGDPFGLGFSGVGGGIYFTLDGSLTMTGTTVSGNVAKYRGAGIYLYADTSATAVIRNCTISGNKTTNFYSGSFFTSGGGGISAQTNPGNPASLTLTIQNSTVYQNSVAAGSKGGGIFAQGTQTSVSIESSVVSGNTANTGPDISAAKAVTLNTSAVGVSVGFTLAVGSANNLAYGLDLKLGALAKNGGPTQTHMPAFDVSVAGNNSPLVDAGANPVGLSGDQRILARSFDNPAISSTRTVDIGAVEAQPAGLPTAVGTAANVTVAGATSYTVNVTYSDDAAIKASTFGIGDITVTNVVGTKFNPTAFNVDVNSDGSPRVVTYTLSPPGGTWDSADAGNYTISVNTGEVTDTSNNAVPAGAVGTFKVLLPRTLVVTNKNDSGSGSLRQAILDANALSPSQDIITFGTLFNTPQTIALTGGALTITDSVKIVGPGTTNLTVDANFTSRHMIIDGPGVLDVQISGMVLTNGRTNNNFQSERGGSVYINGENVTMDTVFLTSNSALKSYGGAIHVQGQGTLNFKNGHITSNSAPQFGGGAISALDAGHTISIINSIVSGNSAGYFGGGVFSSGGGTVNIDSCTFSGNYTTIFDDQGGTVFGGGGGGLMMGDGKTGGALTINNSTFENNQTVGYGGAITFTGSTSGVYVSNSTIANNKSSTQTNGVAGGVLVGNLAGGPVRFDNDTFAYNQSYSGGGLFIGNNDGFSVWARSSIFAQNFSADPTQLPPDIDGALHAENCLIGVLDGAGLDGSSVGNISGSMAGGALDPLFGTLDYNGGPTKTLPILTGSPALDTGSNPNNLSFDQRGAGYPRVSGAAVDIGAFEAQVVAPPAVSDIKIGDGTIQRSSVRSITITFSELVNLGSGVPENAFHLARTGPGGTLGDVGLVADLSSSTGTQTIAILTFNGPLTEGPGSLIDGNYTLTVFGSQVLNNNSVPMPANETVDLFRLFGDSDGNRTINQADFIVFRNAFNTASPAYDFDGDGLVTQADFIQFRNRFNVTLP